MFCRQILAPIARYSILAPMDGDTWHSRPPSLAAGDPQRLTNAIGFGIKRVIHIDCIPIDKRHASKIDRKALARQIT